MEDSGRDEVGVLGKLACSIKAKNGSIPASPFCPESTCDCTESMFSLDAGNESLRLKRFWLNALDESYQQSNALDSPSSGASGVNLSVISQPESESKLSGRRVWLDGLHGKKAAESTASPAKFFDNPRIASASDGTFQAAKPVQLSRRERDGFSSKLEEATNDVDVMLSSFPCLSQNLPQRSSKSLPLLNMSRSRRFQESSKQKKSKPAHAISPNCGSSDFATIDESDVDIFAQLLENPALDFPFELDDFQKRAILCIERHEDCFVAAHTSAGKTVVAEYAIALAGRQGRRVLYTSPIKSLSNQKFRDFSNKFEDVGIVTGDVNIRQSAQCVIMTTEILRSMLYRSDDLLRSVEWVVFDEVQFVNDEERGVVWETCILMLPPHIGIIMLSATVPNAVEFATWVGRTRERCVSVVSSHFRPVPLRHALLHVKPSNLDNSIVDADESKICSTVLLEHGGRFLTANFEEATRRSKEACIVDLERRGSWKTDREIRRKQITTSSSSSGGQIRSHENYRLRTQSARNGDGKDVLSTLVQEVRFEHDTSFRSRELEYSGMRVRSGRDGAACPAYGSSSSSSQYLHRRRKSENSAIRAEHGASLAHRKAGHGTASWIPLIAFLRDNDLTPAILFCFSKKKCALAVESLHNLDVLPSARDKAVACSIFEEAVQKLQETDRVLPQVQSFRGYLRRGIACHHSGLLPIIKEVTEILFAQGLVRILFATESSCHWVNILPVLQFICAAFAMGVNFPARSVAFCGLRKHDGRSFRYLLAGEYTQMSGRAGRRGLDEIGHVFLYFSPDEPLPHEGMLRKIMTGDPLTLRSAFRLTYNMILNILRVDELRVEDMMKKSFSEAAGDMDQDSVNNILASAENVIEEMDVSFSSDQAERRLSQYANALVRIDEMANSILPMLVGSVKAFRTAFCPGRVVLVHSEFHLLRLSIILAGSSYPQPRCTDSVLVLSLIGPLLSTYEGHPKSSKGLCSLVLETDLSQCTSEMHCAFPRFERDGWLFEVKCIQISKVIWFGQDVIDSFGRITMSRVVHETVLRTATLQVAVAFLANAASAGFKKQQGTNCSSSSFNVQSIFQGFVPFDTKGNVAVGAANSGILDQCNERDEIVRSLMDPKNEEAGAMAEVLWTLPGSKKKRFNVLRLYVRREILRYRVESLRTVANAQGIPELLPEYQKRVMVLQKMNYVGDDGTTLLLKGRSGACEVSVVDSVILTEIVLENVLDGLQAAEIASLLSALVCRQKNKASGDFRGQAVKENVQDGDLRITDKKMRDGKCFDIDLKQAEPSECSQSAPCSGNAFSINYVKAKNLMRDVVKRFGDVQEACGIDISSEIGDGCRDYEDSQCRWSLAEVVLAWARGSSFAEIATLTDIQEGDIVVTIKRLAELLKDAIGVARSVGNEELLISLQMASNAIRRDIIFSGSLYLD